jgi:C-terminal processing protease CtpA/Prc
MNARFFIFSSLFSSQSLHSPRSQVPLVVVVDGKTASAAEVLTAALQDNGRAPVVGTQSFGKGVVQNVATLQEGACGVSVTVREMEQRVLGSGLVPYQRA